MRTQKYLFGYTVSSLSKAMKNRIENFPESCDIIIIRHKERVIFFKIKEVDINLEYFILQSGSRLYKIVR